MSSRVTVLFFASLAEDLGHSRLQITAQTTHDMMAQLADKLGPTAVAKLQQDNIRVAVNHTLIEGEQVLNDGDEVAFLPPITGG